LARFGVGRGCRQLGNTLAEFALIGYGKNAADLRIVDAQSRRKSSDLPVGIGARLRQRGDDVPNGGFPGIAAGGVLCPAFKPHRSGNEEKHKGLNLRQLLGEGLADELRIAVGRADFAHRRQDHRKLGTLPLERCRAFTKATHILRVDDASEQPRRLFGT
jgi:hypothetical protein